jgi:hypothetical protein
MNNFEPDNPEKNEIVKQFVKQRQKKVWEN